MSRRQQLIMRSYIMNKSVSFFDALFYSVRIMRNPKGSLES